MRRIIPGERIMAVHQDKLNAFMGKAVGDIGAALSANMVLLGDKLGLYKAMVKAGSHDSAGRLRLRSIWCWKPDRELEKRIGLSHCLRFFDPPGIVRGSSTRSEEALW
jgi:hypothetical protein